MGIANKKIPLDENDGNFLVKVDNRGFRVHVELTTRIAMGIFSSLPTTQDQLATADAAKQCLEIIFKYGLGRSCLSCDTNPQTFFLPVSQIKPVHCYRCVFQHSCALRSVALPDVSSY